MSLASYRLPLRFGYPWRPIRITATKQTLKQNCLALIFLQDLKPPSTRAYSFFSNSILQRYSYLSLASGERARKFCSLGPMSTYCKDELTVKCIYMNFMRGYFHWRKVEQRSVDCGSWRVSVILRSNLGTQADTLIRPGQLMRTAMATNAALKLALSTLWKRVQWICTEIC